MIHSLSLTSLDVLSLALDFWCSEYEMARGCYLLVAAVWGSVCLTYLYVRFFSGIWEVLWHSFHEEIFLPVICAVL